MQKKLIQNCFDNAAKTYDSVAEIQTISSKHLTDFATSKNISSILDIGCGTGNTALELFKKYPNAEFTLCDISPNMLRTASKKFPKEIKMICCDAESYQFDKYYDLAVSNFSMQWFSSIPKFVEKMKNSCGEFVFSTLVNTSFERYKNLFESPPTFAYPSAQQLLDEIPQPKIFELTRYTLEFENFFAIARYFRKLGAYLKSDGQNSLPQNFDSGRIFLDYDVLFIKISYQRCDNFFKK